MRGDTPRNGPAFGGDAARGPVADVFDLLRRRALEVLASLVADGALPSGLDFGGLTAAPPRPGAPGDAVVDAGPVCEGHGSIDRSWLVPALAEGLRAAPEIEAVAVTAGRVAVVTFRSAVLFSAALAASRSFDPCSARPRARDPGGGGAAARSVPATLAEARAEVDAEIRAALSAASGRWGHPLPEIAANRRSSASLAPVVLRGRAPPDGDVLAWIGMDAFRFAVAACRDGGVLQLDLDVLGDRTRADPSFWVRYAHARARGALRRAAAAPSGGALHRHRADPDAAGDAGPAGEGGRRLAWLVACHAHAVASGSPQRLAAHLLRVADAIHSQWNTSKQQPQSLFVNEELREMAEARPGLVTAAALVLRSGLGIIGIGAPDEMP